MFPNLNIDRDNMVKDIEKGLKKIDNHFFRFEVYLFAFDEDDNKYNGVKCKVIAKDNGEYREITIYPVYAYFDPVNAMIDDVKQNKYRIWKDIMKKRKQK